MSDSAAAAAAAATDTEEDEASTIRWSELGSGGGSGGCCDEADEEEKARLVSQILELQNTLEDLGSRVDSVKEENLKLRNENRVLGQYIENLMAASSVFSAGSPKSKRGRASAAAQPSIGKKRAEP
ncbi:hypothetical protein BOX15_Mlig013839g3 [Macrostomum lignano]|uniref:Short coiled-coil protein n=1 Tax=Macrostomum lignano TaxID=282301 RepID=A0A267FMK1_9PLAT|nr:hypothetical protein BOX15_Mlig013839g3 [Macrostomum lignano]